MTTLNRLALALPVFSAFLATPAFAEEPPCPFYENRSGLCGYYHSEISPAEAFVNTVVKRGNWSNPQQRPVILDVRSTSEYKAGYPQHAINVPYPYIYQACDATGRHPDGACKKSVSQINQDPTFFVEYVKKLIPNKDTPIYTLCRTGVRSVGAGNLLTDAGYTNVRNIWEGFVGINLTAPKKQADGTTKTLPVDLNHDGVLDDQDKNGWRYHQALPYETKLLPNLVYKDPKYPGIYDMD
ncbi:MAG: rhodanese-like domain-containing protein [Thiobacillus sp.]